MQKTDMYDLHHQTSECKPVTALLTEVLITRHGPGNTCESDAVHHAARPVQIGMIC